MGKIFLKYFDPMIRKKIKTDEKVLSAWIQDQYEHPVESLHTFDEIIHWFLENNIKPITTLPSLKMYNHLNEDFLNDLSLEKDVMQDKNFCNKFNRIFTQLRMNFNSLGSDGGLFILVGKNYENNKSKGRFLVCKISYNFPGYLFLILYAFPDSELYLIFFTILILAEPHFAATWPIFINAKNKQYIKENKLTLIYGNLLILIFLLFLVFFISETSFLLIFYFFNIYHVTKQSIGILKLYENNNEGLVFKINAIYIFNSVFL